MKLEEFEEYYRDTMDQTLNQLQAATLLIAQIDSKIAEIGNSMQSLSQVVEEFISQQKPE